MESRGENQTPVILQVGICSSWEEGGVMAAHARVVWASSAL